MKAQFSEFSYGFALSYEIMNAMGPQVSGAPLFPSLREEGRSGYDVKLELLGLPLFLQFKLADCMVRSNAKYWSDYGAPFFRVTMRKRTDSMQHNLLRDLSRNEPGVYYAAPAFYRQSEFNQNFASDGLSKESVFFPLNMLPDLTDDEQHYITYCKEVRGFRWHSDHSQYFEVPISGTHWLDHIRQQALRPRELGERYFIDLRANLVELIRKHVLQSHLLHDEPPVNLNNLNPRVVVRDLRYLLVTYCGVEAIILRPQG